MGSRDEVLAGAILRAEESNRAGAAG